MSKENEEIFNLSLDISEEYLLGKRYEMLGCALTAAFSSFLGKRGIEVTSGAFVKEENAEGAKNRVGITLIFTDPDVVQLFYKKLEETKACQEEVKEEK